MDFHTFLIIIHIALGFVGIIIGTIIFWKKKGTETHKKLGTIYIYSMISCMLLGIWLSCVKNDIGFFVTCIIVLFLILSGYADIRHKGSKGSRNINFCLFMYFGVAVICLPALFNSNNYESKMPIENCTMFLCLSMMACATFVEWDYKISHISKMIASYFILFAGFAINSLQYLISVKTIFWISLVFVFLVFPAIVIYCDSRHN